MKTRCPVVLASILIVAGLAPALTAQAQEPWPAKPVRMIVPFAPGGATDLAARLVTQKLTASLGRQVYVENRAGAGGSIGAEAAARAAGDGYTLIMGTTGTHAINFSLYDKPSSDPIRDFVAITRVAVFPNLILLHPSVPAKNVQELIALAKAQPGKIAYASTGSLLYLSAALFTSMAGVDMLNVPFSGAGPMMTAISNNDVQMSVVPVFSSLPLVRAGKVRAIAITSASRSPTAPEYPTVAESGLPGYESVSWYGILATAGTPKPIVDRLNSEIRRIVATAEIRDALSNQGAEPATDTPEEFAAIVRADVAKWANIVKATGAKPN
ncbi:MAG: tripartite tricarboxylate transporter substrate binding protein [Betaproteobacteria bacterium]|nr:tripartite tricarboxylate transporter substrate binding protein [Betaproteobacteria bacterium]